MILTIATFIFVLSLLVFVHELGHYLTARRFGLIPEEFGFGFPPRAWGIYKNKDGIWKSVKGKKEVKDAAGTVYSINWLPLGGFVKLGEDDADIPPDANHFHNKPVWQRAVMLLAGVSMNVVLAIVLISFGFVVGLPQVTEDLPGNAIVSNRQIQVVDVLPDTPAQSAGLKMGDVMVGADGYVFKDSTDLQTFTDEHQDQALEYLILRGQEEVRLEITPVFREETKAGSIGVGIVDTGLVRYPVHIAVWEGIKSTVLLTITIIMAFYELFKNIFTGQGVSTEIAGPVGIAVITGQVARLGFIYILQFAAILSINLAIINAAPFPALDGGRVLFLIIEKLKGRPVKRELEGTIHYIGFALLMLLILVVTFRDISKLGDNLKFFWDKIIR